MANSWKMKGHYVKNCNCISTCPCDTTGIPYPHKGCEGMVGMQITEGHFGEVKLDSVKWAVVYQWPGPLHEGNGTVQPFIDAQATDAQRNAILQILSGQAGNPWFEFVASTVIKMHDPQFVPIHFEFDKEMRTAKVLVPGFLETISAPLQLPNVDTQQRMTIHMPTGMEYRDFEVARSKVLKGTGPIKFNHANTNSSLADVEQTDHGLIR